MTSREHNEARYEAAMHRMQTGVATMMSKDSTEATPKNLRVGVNSALLNDAAVARLLIAKGVFTMEEYWEAVASEAEAEADRYEVRVQEVFGTDRIGLG